MSREQPASYYIPIPYVMWVENQGSGLEKEAWRITFRAARKGLGHLDARQRGALQPGTAISEAETTQLAFLDIVISHFISPKFNLIWESQARSTLHSTSNSKHLDSFGQRPHPGPGSSLCGDLGLASAFSTTANTTRGKINFFVEWSQEEQTLTEFKILKTY